MFPQHVLFHVPWPVFHSVRAKLTAKHAVTTVQRSLAGPVLLLVVLPGHPVTLGDVGPEGGVVTRGVVTQGTGAGPPIEAGQTLVIHQH